MARIIFEKRIPEALRRSVKFLTAGLVMLCLISTLLPTVNAAETEQKQPVTLNISQVIKSESPSDGSFTYRLTSKTASAPMPAAGNIFSVTGTDEMEIGDITFAAPGVYTYEISCVTNQAAGYTVDRQIYTIDIYAKNDLTAVVVIHTDAGKADEIYFEHIYEAAADPVKPTDTTTSKPDEPKDDYTKKFPLPITGGIGTVFFTAGGISIIGGALFLLFLGLRRKREKQQEAE